MEKINEIKELLDKLSVDANKVFEKGNYSAGVRARNMLVQLSKLLVPAREEILIKMKSLPKKPRKNDNLLR